MARALVNTIGISKRNLLINGAFDFFQRSPVAAVNFPTEDLQRILAPDRWLTWRNSVAITGSVEKSATDPSGKSSNWLLIKANASNSGQGIHVAQRVESSTAKELFAYDSLSVSVLVKSASMSNVQLRLKYPTTKDTFGGESPGAAQTLFYTSSSASIPTNSAVTLIKFENIPLNANIINGMQVELIFAGSTITGSSQNLFVSEIMLNAGPKAMPFVRAGLTDQQELAMCQRYYEKSYNQDVAPATSTSVGAIAAAPQNGTTNANALAGFKFQTFKRNTPTTVTIYSSAGATNSIRFAGSDFAVTGSAGQTAGIVINNTGGAFSSSTGNTTALFHFAADAEL